MSKRRTWTGTAIWTRWRRPQMTTPCCDSVEAASSTRVGERRCFLDARREEILDARRGEAMLPRRASRSLCRWPGTRTSAPPSRRQPRPRRRSPPRRACSRLPPRRRPCPYRLRPHRRYRLRRRRQIQLRRLRQSPSRRSSPPSTAPSGLREVHIDPVRARAMYIVSPRRALPVIILVLLSVFTWRVALTSYQSLGELRFLRGGLERN